MSENQKRSWYVANTGSHQGLIIDENTGRTIAVAYDKADAPLIAAAPDLLAACQVVRAAIRGFSRLDDEAAMIQANAAIDAATEESE